MVPHEKVISPFVVLTCLRVPLLTQILLPTSVATYCSSSNWQAYSICSSAFPSHITLHLLCSLFLSRIYQYFWLKDMGASACLPTDLQSCDLDSIKEHLSQNLASNLFTTLPAILVPAVPVADNLHERIVIHWNRIEAHCIDTALYIDPNRVVDLWASCESNMLRAFWKMLATCERHVKVLKLASIVSERQRVNFTKNDIDFRHGHVRNPL